MKQIFFAAALALAFVSCNSQGVKESTTEVVAVTSSDLAFVTMERVLAESDIFKTEGIPLQQRTEASQRDWSQQEQKLQSDALNLQQKYQNGLITTTNAQLEQQKIEKRAEEFRTTTQREAQVLEEENGVFANRAQQLILKAINNVNADKRYRMIVNASALIDADSTLDISTIVLDELNKLYKEESK